MRRFGRFALVGALVASVAVPVFSPSPAKAWWVAGWGWRPGIVIAPPAVVVAPPVVVAAPVYPAPPPRHWIPPHYTPSGAWVPGHWAY